MNNPEALTLELVRLEMWLASRAARLEARRCLATALGDLGLERDLTAQLQELDQDRNNLPALARHNLEMRDLLRQAVRQDAEIDADDWDDEPVTPERTSQNA